MLHLNFPTSNPVILTGASGWFGQAALEMFRDRYVMAYGSRDRLMTLRNGRVVEVQALESIATLNLPNALVLHCAFLTREHASTQPLDTYRAANRRISALIQRFLHRNGAAGLFYPSSGAAYTLIDNPYGELKREDEAIFADLGTQLGFPTAIFRVFNLAGPFINKLDSYALGCILSDLLANRPITLRAAHPVLRGYAHVEDVLNLALGSLLHAPLSSVMDTGGSPIEISALAERAAYLLDRAPQILRPDGWQSSPSNIYLGDHTAYAAQANRVGLVLRTLDQQIRDTAAYISALPPR